MPWPIANEELRLRFAQNLRAAMDLANMSAKDLVQKSGGLISYANLTRYTHGDGLPMAEKLIAIADALQISIDSLFAEEGEQ